MAPVKTLSPCLVFLLLLSAVNFSEAREFRVGGRNGYWEVPSPPDEFNRWAEKIRFEIGDAIVMEYDAKADSVLQVTEDHYNTCNKTSPVKSYDDGKTEITLDRSGPFFFISGVEGHCEKGQKLEIIVLSAKHGMHSPPLAAAPSPVDNYHPAPAPATHSGSGQREGFMGGAGVALVGLWALI